MLVDLIHVVERKGVCDRLHVCGRSALRPAVSGFLHTVTPGPALLPTTFAAVTVQRPRPSRERRERGHSRCILVGCGGSGETGVHVAKRCRPGRPGGAKHKVSRVKKRPRKTISRQTCSKEYLVLTELQVQLSILLYPIIQVPKTLFMSSQNIFKIPKIPLL